MAEQASLGDFGVETNPEPTGVRENVRNLKKLLDDDAEPWNDHSCPWCCAPPRKFRRRYGDTVGCGSCDSAIPVEADWYNRGEKIINV